MNKRILFLLLLCFISLLDAKKIGEKKRILVSQIAPDTYRMRIYFNYENPFSTYKNLEEPVNELTLNVPLPDRFEVIKIRKSLTYKTGLSVNPSNSYILDMVNNNVVFQTPLVSELGAGATETISFEIPPSQLYEGYNKHTVLVIQNSILHKIAEKMSASKIQDISKNFLFFILLNVFVIQIQFQEEAQKEYLGDQRFGHKFTQKIVILNMISNLNLLKKE